MNMLEMLMQAQGGNALGGMAKQLGISPDQAQSVLGAVLPAIASGFKQQASSADGLSGLVNAIRATNYEQVYEQGASAEEMTQMGNDVLGQIFGSKDVSRGVAQHAAEQSGVSADIIKQMLPMIASVVMGGLQRRESTTPGMGDMLGQLVQGAMAGGQPQAGGGLGGLLGGLLGGGGQAQAGGALGGLLGGLLGGAARAPQQPQGGIGGLLNGMLDADGNGSAADDLLRMLMKR